jgi:hypothetical protein
MPVERIQLRPRKRYDSLRDALVAELNAGADGTLGGPRIVEEELPQHRFYVTVIWPEWVQVPAEDRGRIILEAYQEAGVDKTLRISVALGLTPDEAMRIGKNSAG